MRMTIRGALEERIVSGDIDGALAIFAASWATACDDEGVEMVRAAASQFSPEEFLRSQEALAARVLVSTMEGNEDIGIVENFREYLLKSGGFSQKTRSPSEQSAVRSSGVQVTPIAQSVSPWRGRLVMSAGLMSVLLHRGEIVEACAVADATMSELVLEGDFEKRFGEDPAEARGLFWFRFQAGQSYMAAGRMGAAKRQWTALVSSPPAQVGSGARRAFVGRSMLALACAVDDTLGAAQSALAEAEAAGIAGGWFTGVNRAMTLTATQLLQITHLELAAAIETQTQLIDAIGDDKFLSFAVAPLRSDVSRLSGTSEEALAAIHVLLHGQEFTATAPEVLASLRYAQAALHLAIGRPGLAIVEMGSIDADEEHSVCVASREALGWIALGLPRIALKRIEACLLLGVTHNRRSWVQVLAVRVAAMHAVANTTKSLDALRELCALIDDYGAEGLTLLPPSVLDEMLEIARANSIDVPSLIATARGFASDRLDHVYKTIGRLTGSQRLLLNELDSDATFEVIALKSFVATNTLKSHSRSLYHKLGVRTRQEAVDSATQAGLYELNARERLWARNST